MKVLARRRFTPADQAWFAALSGDHNPLHVDAIEARRSLPGRIVAHGVHVALWALEAGYALRAVEGASVPPALRHLRIKFARPVFLDEEVAAVALDDSGQLAVTGPGEGLLVHLGCSFEASARPSRELPAGAVTRAAPRALSLDECEGFAGETPLFLDAAAARSAFPLLLESNRAEPLAALIALSRVVGMDCPGRHSLFAGIDVGFEADGGPASLRFRVRETRPAASLVRMAVEGGGMRGSVDAFALPPPVRQPPVSELRSLVGASELAGQSALIVGGSRGLGEATAKIVAAGGGRAVVTFHLGRSDAERVASEIRGAGLRCESRPFDVTDRSAALAEGRDAFTHLYYFASPKIGTRREPGLDAALLQAFIDCYVIGFERACALALPPPPARLVAFYPSTVFIDELTADSGEYVIAKTAGEALCRHLARRQPRLHVVARRLPRVATDQTAALVRRRAEDAVAVMLPIVRELHAAAGRSEA